ncbi:MAG: hypothetical protein ACRBB6_01665 [Neptuniibacter sp.]
MPAEFKVQPFTEGQFKFEFVNANGEQVMLSATFPDEEKTEKAIQDVRVGSMMSQFIAKGQTAQGDFYFIVKDTNGTELAKSVTYSSEMQFDNALHNFRDTACIAEISYE